jgi:hypothetical protein
MHTLDHHQGAGSHQPLDVGTHWSWRNPLNAIPLTLILLVALALLSAAATATADLVAFVAALVSRV